VEECKPLARGRAGVRRGSGGRARQGHPAAAGAYGRAVQVDPTKPTLKAPGTKRLRLKYDGVLSGFAFKSNSRRYSTELLRLSGMLYGFLRHVLREQRLGRPLQIDPMIPKLKPPGTERLKLKCDVLLPICAFKFKLRRYASGTRTTPARATSSCSCRTPTASPASARCCAT
jgi:hypothetical protein